MPGAASAVVFRFGSYVVSADSGAVGTTDALGDFVAVGVQSLGGEVQGIPLETLSFLVQSGPGGFATDAIPATLDPPPFHGDAQAYMGPGASQRLLGATIPRRFRTWCRSLGTGSCSRSACRCSVVHRVGV